MAVGAITACYFAWRAHDERRRAEAVNALPAFTPAASASAGSAAAHHDVGEALPKLVTCITGVQNPARNGAELSKRLARGSEGRYASLGKHLREDCTPALRRDLDAVRTRFLAVSTLAEPWKAFDRTALAFAASVDAYSKTLESHVKEDSVDHSLVEAARKWSERDTGADDASRFERFLACAVPDAATRLDKDRFARWIPPQCAQGDPVRFMTRIREECAPLLTAAAPAPATTPDDPAAMSVIKRARVLNGSMSLPTFLFTACAEGIRRKWNADDGASLVPDYDAAVAAQNTLANAVLAIKTRIASPQAP